MSEFNSVEEKISFLYKIKKETTVEIYKLCLRCGIDPNFFDYSSFTVTPNYSQMPQYLQSPFAPKLEKLCKQLIDLEKKIKELENV